MSAAGVRLAMIAPAPVNGKPLSQVDEPVDDHGFILSPDLR
jgi:hypothetical protein